MTATSCDGRLLALSLSRRRTPLGLPAPPSLRPSVFYHAPRHLLKGQCQHNSKLQRATVRVRLLLVSQSGRRWDPTGWAGRWVAERTLAVEGDSSPSSNETVWTLHQRSEGELTAAMLVNYSLRPAPLPPAFSTRLPPVPRSSTRTASLRVVRDFR